MSCLTLAAVEVDDVASLAADKRAHDCSRDGAKWRTGKDETHTKVASKSRGAALWLERSAMVDVE